MIKACMYYPNSTMNRVLIIAFLFFAKDLCAYDLLVGAGIGYRSIEITDNQAQTELATFQTQGSGFSPSITLRSAPKYIWDNSNWGYTLSADFFTSKLTKQLITTTDNQDVQLKDKGTQITGFSLYTTPLMYYQFGRETPKSWQYRAGFGLGIGYQNHRGSFLATNPYQENFGKVEKINHSGFGLSSGLYFEASHQNHIITISIDGISAEPAGYDYQYLESTASLSYRYQIYSFFLNF